MFEILNPVFYYDLRVKIQEILSGHEFQQYFLSNIPADRPSVWFMFRRYNYLNCYCSANNFVEMLL